METLTFPAYLALCHDLLTDSAPKTIVLGNEAADLDSMVSSLAYAYLLNTQKHPRQQQTIAVMPIPRADFKLRPEAVYLFRKAHINRQDIIFRDEIDLAAIMAENTSKLVLVDHNKLADNLDFADKVVALIDHHVDEGIYQTARPRIIKTVGSTASLVTLEIHRKNPSLLTKQLATLLLGTILLDTINLDPEAGRMSPTDQKAVQYLLPVFNDDQNHFFTSIQAAKFNLADLSSADLLRQDYKQWQAGTISYGISTVLISSAEWRRRDPLLTSSLVNFANTRGITILLVMNGYNTPEFNRDLIIYTASSQMHTKVLTTLQNNNLQLTAIPPDNTPSPTQGRISFYHQANQGISRKILQPILQKSLK